MDSRLADCVEQQQRTVDRKIKKTANPTELNAKEMENTLCNFIVVKWIEAFGRQAAWMKKMKKMLIAVDSCSQRNVPLTSNVSENTFFSVWDERAPLSKTNNFYFLWGEKLQEILAKLNFSDCLKPCTASNMSTDDSKQNRGPHLIDFQARECPRHHAIDDVPKKCYWKWKAVGFMPWWWRTTRLLTAVLLNVHERSAQTFSLSIRCVLCAVVDVDASTYISTADADFNRDNKLWFPLPSFRALFFSNFTSFFPSLVAVFLLLFIHSALRAHMLSYIQLYYFKSIFTCWVNRTLHTRRYRRRSY